MSVARYPIFTLLLAFSQFGACTKDTTTHEDGGPNGSNPLGSDATSEDGGLGDGGHQVTTGSDSGRPGSDGGLASLLGPTAMLGANVAGKACTSATDCAGTNTRCDTTLGGLFGRGGTTAPDGYCSGSCQTDANCGTGGVCVGAFGGFVPGSCEQACQSDADCTRTGYNCAQGATRQGTTTPSTCLPTPKTVQLADGIVGQACTADADCGAGTCATMAGRQQTFPDGYCTGACTQDSQCGANGICFRNTAFGGNTAGTCYLDCTQCTRDGYVCGAIRRSNMQACVPSTARPDAGVSTDAGSDGG